MSVTVVTFYYVSSISAVYSVVSLFRPKKLTSEEVMFVDRNNQPNCMKIGSFKIEKHKTEHRSNDEETDFPEAVEDPTVEDEGPPLQMELARRSVEQTNKELWLFLRYQLRRLHHAHKMRALDTFNQHEKIIEYILDNLAEYHSAIDDQLGSLTDNDGWNTWRKQELKRLHNTVQERLYKLQNPKNCSATPVLLCNLTNPNGFASGIHDVLWCFIKAYYSRERMVLVSSSWHYALGGWETLFKPLSDTCEGEVRKPRSTGPGDNNGKARRLMALLPSDLGPRILRMHGNPLAWWHGQFLYYLMRPNARLQAFLQEKKEKINFNGTVVGVHVRRTDKIGSEARSHMLDEYMGYVDDYFLGREMIQSSPMQRRIYLATDDPQVITECRRRFEKYLCIYNSRAAATASDIQTRYKNASLFGVLADVFMLANTNFLVCTFSSGLCRLAYELMQAFHLENYSDRFVSLDVQFYYAWRPPPIRSAIYNHKARSPKELSFEEGEMFQKKNEYAFIYEALKGKRNNGFAQLVKLFQKEREGFIPIFKTKEIYKFKEIRDSTDYDLSVDVTS